MPGGGAGVTGARLAMTRVASRGATSTVCVCGMCIRGRRPSNVTCPAATRASSLGASPRARRLSPELRAGDAREHLDGAGDVWLDSPRAPLRAATRSLSDPRISARVKCLREVRLCVEPPAECLSAQRGPVRERARRAPRRVSEAEILVGAPPCHRACGAASIPRRMCSSAVEALIAPCAEIDGRTESANSADATLQRVACSIEDLRAVGAAEHRRLAAGGGGAGRHRRGAGVAERAGRGAGGAAERSGGRVGAGAPNERPPS